MALIACNKEAPAPLAHADFYAENNGCTAPCQLKFYGQSTNAVKWRWSFGNGKISSFEDDSTLYSSAGNYEVWLRVWNSDDIADSVRKSVVIN